MSKEIVISKDRQHTLIAIVENGVLAELFIESDEYERTLGNLFLGRVRRIMPSIQAAFVDVGQKQDAFLHFSDLHENLQDWLAFAKEKSPTIESFSPQHMRAHKGRKRRRPNHGRPKRGPDGELVEFEEDDERADQGDGQGKRHQPVAGSAARSRRKSAQARRGRGRSRRESSGGRSSDSEIEESPPEHFLRSDQPILVKISKEPISAKGSRVTTDISLAGRFIVLVPMANYVAVSKKSAHSRSGAVCARSLGCCFPTDLA